MGISAATAAGAVTPRPAPCLPAPTGPHPVGTAVRQLRDESRPDPWVEGVDVRELLISLWYPTAAPSGPCAPYLTPTESELLLGGKFPSVPDDALSATRTNAILDAVPVGAPDGRPLVVLSPGFTKPRHVLTGLAEELASHGYLAAAIDHAYESVGTAFPDGRVLTCRARENRRRGPEFWHKVVTGRAADVSFVLDQLTGSQPPWSGAELIDPTRISMVGHSVGGASSLAALVADARIRAGINLDGSTHTLIPSTGLARPFLFLGKAANYTPDSGNPAAAGWARDWAQLTAWKRWFVVAGASHPSFTDLGLLAGQLGVDTGATLPGARAMELTRACVLAFVDLHLRGLPQPLLDQPSARYPEITNAGAGLGK